MADNYGIWDTDRESWYHVVPDGHVSREQAEAVRADIVREHPCLDGCLGVRSFTMERVPLHKMRAAFDEIEQWRTEAVELASRADEYGFADHARDAQTRADALQDAALAVYRAAGRPTDWKV